MSSLREEINLVSNAVITICFTAPISLSIGFRAARVLPTLEKAGIIKATTMKSATYTEHAK